MCVAIFKPANVRIDKEDLRLAHRANKDGSGFAIRHRQGVYIDKGLWKFEDFWNRYKAYQDFEALIHFRWATLGGISAEMCHPFSVASGAMVHNGHIDGYGSKAQSDTLAWCTQALAPILTDNPAMLKNKAFCRMLGESIGGRNKIIVMLPDIPTVMIGKGIEESGIWYSNLDYRRVQQWELWPARKSTTPALGGPAYYEESEESESYPYAQECESCNKSMDLEYSVCQECYDFLADMSGYNEHGRH